MPAKVNIVQIVIGLKGVCDPVARTIMSKMKQNCAALGHKVKSGLNFVFGKETILHCCLQILFLSLFSTIVVESFSRFSFFKAIGFMVGHPVLFFFNLLIVITVYTPALLFRRKPAMYFFLTILLIAAGVIDFVVLHNRTTPFNANDFHMLVDGWNVLFHYYNWAQVIGLLFLILLGIALIILGFIKFPKSKEKVKYKERVPFFLIASMSCILIVISGRNWGVLETHFSNVASAYREYGLPYCFSCSLLDKGISKPSNYSPDVIDNVIGDIDPIVTTGTVTDEPVITEVTVNDTNIIFIQLESFFDPKRIAGIEFESDPIPTFTYLKENYTSGLLTVPSISAGTANTEFEVLTGMNIRDFGTGEYPYKTILRTVTCESLAYNLRALGLDAHAIHNNIASFYNRDSVYANLGFEDFDTLEVMEHVEFNELNWARDSVLLPEILSALDSTEGLDFVFTVSVQGHGSYPDEDILENAIELKDVNAAYSDDTIYGLKYYITQLNEMDTFIAGLLTELKRRDEKTVLVLYGDHLPGFNFTDENLTYGTTLQTEYVIWSNFAMTREKRDLTSYQLSAYVLGRLGLHEGLLTKLNQKELNNGYESEEEYLNALQMLSYDMLYGEHYCFDGEIPYEPTELVFGYTKPRISAISVIMAEDNKGYLTVGGDHFTSYSKVYINGVQMKDTIYVSQNQLFVALVSLQPGDEIKVVTLGSDSRELTESLAVSFSESSILNPTNN